MSFNLREIIFVIILYMELEREMGINISKEFVLTYFRIVSMKLELKGERSNQRSSRTQ